ncbi:MAG: hypothetical protein IJO67_08955 [Clostridia bacterium]|nr:hypothetical protein [Clostridia bacterium]
MHPPLPKQSAIGYTFYCFLIISKQEDIVKKNSSPFPAKEGFLSRFCRSAGLFSPMAGQETATKKAPWQQREANVP